ncbi:hypothetical protein [Desertibaculum subflavum]|uniref:hypothetical protein n=1 Tax=Desertibaculum subflavum TaxID=2268458 RepID=UPI000E668350
MSRSAFLRGLGNGLLAVISIGLALVVVEFGLRAFFYGSLAEPDFSQRFHEPHPTRGWTLRPNVVTTKQELDYKVPVVVNSRGLRGPEIGYERTPGIFRIMIVGDSAMFSSGTDDQNTVPVLLAEMLAPLKVEVINLSVAAYSNVQENLFLKDEGRKYRPDLVLLAFTPSNDVQTNHEPLQRLYQGSQRRPFASLDGDGRLVIEYQHAEREAKRREKLAQRGAVRRMLQNSALLRLVGVARHKLIAEPVDPNIYPGWPHLAEFDPRLGLNGRTAEEYEKLWSEAWRVTRALIGEMQAEARAMGAGFGIFVAPSMLQGDAATQARVRDAFPGIKLDVGRINRELAAFAAEIGAAYIPVLRHFNAAAATSASPLFHQFEDEHLNAAGNRVVAAALARGLREGRLLPGNSAPLDGDTLKRSD